MSVIQGAIRGESRAVFTSQDTTPALQTCSKMSPEQGRTTGAARTPRNTINYQGNIYEIFSSILFPFVTIRRRISSRVDYEFAKIFSFFVGTFRIKNLLQKMNYYCEDYPVS